MFGDIEYNIYFFDDAKGEKDMTFSCLLVKLCELVNCYIYIDCLIILK
jgi:hypothetical protein